MKEFLKLISSFLNYKIEFTNKIGIQLKYVLLIIIFLLAARIFLSLFERLVKKRLQREDKNKFDTIFSFSRWFIYIIIFLSTLKSIGFDVTAVFAASAALLVGVGLAMQTWFQDIMSGIFIIIDKSVHVGDIIEINDKVGRVEEIRLRTTRAVTINNKVLIIPNHLYLTTSLFNWTQNGRKTRETIAVGVAYGSDLQLVKKLLLQAASENKEVLQHPAPMVLFDNFGDNALELKLIFTLGDSFTRIITQSEIRFRIDELFRANQISIPFPQRDVHIIQHKN